MAVTPLRDEDARRLQPIFVAGLRNLGFDHPEQTLDDVDWLRIPRGEVLFREGERDRSLYLILTGRLRVIVGDVAEQSSVIRTMGPGECFGEISLLTGEPRAATIQAARDTEVARLCETTAAKKELLADSGFVLPLARLVANRLRTQIGWRPRPSTTVALVTTDPQRLGIDTITEQLHEFSRDAFDVSVLSVADIPEGIDASSLSGDESGALGAWLSEEEMNHDFVFLAVDPSDSVWARQCVRQADRVVFLAPADGRPNLDSVGALTELLDRQPLQPLESLILVHSASTERPSGTERWLALRAFDSFHHARLGSREDTIRLARVFCGSGVGLVLSGGGARAFGHIGVIRALEEAGIPIDIIGGSSIGSVMAAQYAQGWTTGRMLEVNRAEWNGHRIDHAFTLPLVSLWSVRRVRRMFRRMFGDAKLEDLWIDCFVATTNLSTCRLDIHRRGPVRRWTRASSSVPALWPPVVDENGELFVDGGVLDNLPVRAMIEQGAGPVIAVNVSPYTDMRVPPGTTEPATGLSYLAKGVFGRSQRVPHIVNLLYRTGGIGGLHTWSWAQTHADLLLQPPLGQYAVNAYEAIDEIVETAYEDAKQTLAATADKVFNWRLG